MMLTMGTGDDVAVPIVSIIYTTGDLEVRLNFSAQLPQGLYRLTLVSGATNAIVDQSSNALDGDNNGTPGRNLMQVFQLDLTPPTVGTVTPADPVAVGPSQFTVIFTENLQMDAATGTNPPNYTLLASLDENFGNADDTNESARISGVIYDPATKTATVTLSAPLPARRYQFLVRSTITDQASNALGNGVTYISPLQVGVPHLSPPGNQSVCDSTLLSFSLAFQFNRDFLGSLGVNDLSLRNLTTNADISPASMALAYNAATNQATLTFPGLAGHKLPDGNYRLTVVAAGITGPHNKPMAANVTFDFYALTGDVNGDRVTNDRDLYEVWQNLLKPSASRNLNDDIDGDGQVTQADVNVVKSNYLAALPTAAPPFVPAAAASLAGNPAPSSGTSLPPAKNTTQAAVLTASPAATAPAQPEVGAANPTTTPPENSLVTAPAQA